MELHQKSSKIVGAKMMMFFTIELGLSVMAIIIGYMV
jgi:hypothetical protein